VTGERVFDGLGGEETEDLIVRLQVADLLDGQPGSLGISGAKVTETKDDSAAALPVG
jgi:hypothetical protein